jgi:hypothetical protein
LSTASFQQLASGSSGNSALLEFEGRRLLIDAGLNPRRLLQLLQQVETDWSSIDGMLLTHTHADHWHRGVMAQLLARRIRLYCHPGHRKQLQLNSSDFALLALQGLVHYFEAGTEFEPLPGVGCLAWPVPHDGGPTFGFRLWGTPRGATRSWVVCYAADLGSWSLDLPTRLANADLLALEFNHDLDLQLNSQRPTWLISRVLSDVGHLSNTQATRLVKECLTASTLRRPKVLVQLHLSKECNTAELAAASVQGVLGELSPGTQVQTTWQGEIAPRVDLRDG